MESGGGASSAGTAEGGSEGAGGGGGGRESDAVRCLSVLSAEGSGRSVAVGRDSGRLEAVDGMGRCVFAWSGHEQAVHALASSADGALLASVSRDRSVRVWRAGAREPATTLLGHTLNVTAVACARDGSWVASGARDTSVRVWDVASARCVGSGRAPLNMVTALGRVGDRVLAQGSEDLRVYLWDLRMRAGGSLDADGAISRADRSLDGYTYFPVSLAVSPDEHCVATGSKGFDGNGSEVRIWDLRNKAKPLATLLGHQFDATGLAWTSLHSIVSVSKDETLRRWRTADAGGDDGGESGGGAWASRGSLFVAGSGGCTSVACWDDSVLLVGTHDRNLVRVDLDTLAEL